MGRKEQGSLTAYAAMSLMLVLSVIAAYLEVTRYMAYEDLLQLSGDAAIESLFAGYSIPLWENYHLLGISLGEEQDEISFKAKEEKLQEYTEDMLCTNEEGVQKGLYLFPARLNNVSFLSYSLMTDEEGLIYEKMVANSVKERSGLSYFERILDQFEENSFMKREQIDSIREAAISAVEEADEHKNTTLNFDEEQKIEEAGLLKLVIEEPDAISQKSIYGKDLPSNRNCFVGKYYTGIDEDCFERESAFADKYIMDYYHSKIFDCYTTGKNKERLEGILDYQLEYLIAGRQTDMENLKEVVGKIYWIRLASNYAYLLTDQGRCGEALLMAETLVGASMNPLLVEAVKQGLLISLAAAESILDLRALLQGKKVAVMKTSEDWTSSLSNLAAYREGYLCAKENPRGLDYKGYLLGLLCLRSRSETAYYAMDLMEGAIEKLEGYENFRMDRLMVQAEVQYEYNFSPAFASAIYIGQKKTDHFSRYIISSYSY